MTQYEDLTRYGVIDNVKRFVGIILSRKRPKQYHVIVESQRGELCTVDPYNVIPMFPHIFDRKHMVGRQLIKIYETV